MNFQPPDPPEYGHCLTCKTSIHQDEVRGDHCIECEPEAMTTNQTIDGVPRSLLQSLYTDTLQQWGVGGNAASQLRALLDKTDADIPASTPQGVPVALTAVGVLRDDGDGGLAPGWTLEGGTAELWEGAVLLIAAEDQELCAEDGHCTLYRGQSAPVAVVLPERRDFSPQSDSEWGWNACLDEVARLTATVRILSPWL